MTDLSQRIAGLRLFHNIGLPISAEANNPRIYDWSAWPGPEAEGSQLIAFRQQELHDSLVAPEAEQAWLSLLRYTHAHASAILTIDPNEDVWYAPTAAAWSAAWVFALERLHLSLDRPLPADLQSQIAWYERGHWPCAVWAGRSGRRLDDYVIF